MSLLLLKTIVGGKVKILVKRNLKVFFFIKISVLLLDS